MEGGIRALSALPVGGLLVEEEEQLPVRDPGSPSGRFAGRRRRRHHGHARGRNGMDLELGDRLGLAVLGELEILLAQAG
jgi:hypothetical protein